LRADGQTCRIARLAFAALAAWTVALPSLEARERPWVELKNCRLDADASNDADSFHVKAQGREYIFRLYFVDAAETDAGFPERVAEQAKYFGVTPAQAIQLGILARTFTRQKLATPFTVRTRMQDALGRSKKQRFYAFIETSEGDLGELLVANGLARVHGAIASSGTSAPARQKRKLEQLERVAKQQKVGAWGASVGRMTARLPKDPAKNGVSSFDAFFHPERIVAAAAEDRDVELEATAVRATSAPLVPPPTTRPAATSGENVAQSVPTATAAGGKLDPNTATAEQLMALNGIGPVLASRIIEARPYKNSNELQKAKGIGPKKYEAIRPYFIDPPDAEQSQP
jgi:DNA uptake protein ComE-like DNA-binding protein/endonuclease YncB( thermonuclease family)